MNFQKLLAIVFSSVVPTDWGRGWRPGPALYATALGLVFFGLAAGAEKRDGRISFYASVTDKQGLPVETLVQSDFQLYEDKKPVPLQRVQFQKNAPLSLGVLIDVSRSMGAGQTDAALRWVKALAEKMASPDELFIMIFHEDAELAVDYISPEDYLDEALDHLSTGGSAYTGLAVDRALAKLREAHNPKRLLLMLSAGVDKAGPATLEHIGRYRYPIYALSMASSGGAAAALDQLKALNVHGSPLNSYTDISGGLDIKANSDATAIAALERYYRQWRSMYLLEYLSPNTKSDGKYRKVEVKVSNADHQVRCLEKYFVPAKTRQHVPEQAGW